MAVLPAALSTHTQVQAAERSERLHYLDNLRVLLTAWVIVHHAGQAYGPRGGFWPVMDQNPVALLSAFFTVNRSFGMSLFFLIAGFFMVRSYDSRGPRVFILSRLTRLGFPMLAVALLLMALQALVVAAMEGGAIRMPEFSVYHMWFVEHLLIFNLCYAGWRALAGRRGEPAGTPAAAGRRLARVPGAPVIILFALALGFVSAVVRIWFPIDDWRNLFGFIRVAFADVPRDLSFFIIGALAYRHQWLQRLSDRAATAWLIVGLALAALWYLYQALGGLREDLSGPWGALAYAWWESLLCCGLCIGLLGVCRDRLNGQTPFSAELARSQYTAYAIHVVFVMGLQAAALSLPLAPMVKFIAVSVMAIPLTFLVSSLIRRPLHL